MMNFNKHKITLCHYAMHVWHQSHKGSWMLFGHSHGDLNPIGKTFDIGVDAHNFEPWSMEEIEAEMAKRPLGHVIPKDKIWSGLGEPRISNTQAGSTVHLPDCDCGFCNIGNTKMIKAPLPAWIEDTPEVRARLQAYVEGRSE